MSGKTKLGDKEYEELLKPLARELALWRAGCPTKQRLVIVFEGRDTAGKGGSIDMFARVLNPRQCRVAALPSPNERERTQWYFQRYVEHFPAEGEIVLFDRSWYNRAGVEKVMGFCTPEETEAFLRAVPEFERQFVDDGILFFKYWLTCDQAVQEDRFENRLTNPMKRWKLSPIVSGPKHYEDYTEARGICWQRRIRTSRRGRWSTSTTSRSAGLTLLRDLLDRVPDTELALDDIAWAPLPHEPLKERFTVLKPIPSYLFRRARASSTTRTAKHHHHDH